MVNRFSRSTPWTIVMVVSFTPLLFGCAASRPQIVVHESPRGSVSIEKAERAFQAAHPIVIEPIVITKVLQGVYVQEGEETALGSVFASSPKVVRVFSDEDVRFLSPLLATALKQASQNQVINFRLNYVGGLIPAGGGAGVGSSERVSSAKIETTSGTVYAYGMSLNLTLTEYRHRPERPDAINMPNRRLPDPTGLGERKVVFLPEAARKPDNYSPRPAGNRELTTLVIDYQLLAKLPASALEAPQPSTKGEAGRSQEASSEEIQSIKDRLIKKDREMETMKEELKSIRKQLDDREAQKPVGPRNETPR
jgi:hypothetical protein